MDEHHVTSPPGASATADGPDPSRVLDVVVAATALVVLAPALLALALLVRLRLGAPVLFRQVRPGLGGEPFELLKFRTMTDARGADGELLPDADRLTPFGARLRSSSLDELPELVNILRGDMALVGPRPLLVQYLDRYSPEQARRHEVRPGLTGWAQVHGRNDMTWDDKLALDVWYVDNRSLLLDLRVLARTVGVLLSGDGVSQAGHATAPEFLGPDQHPPAPGGHDGGHPDVSRTPPPSVAPRPVDVGGGGAGVAGPQLDDDLALRRADDGDLPGVLALLEASLGWVPDDQYAEFFAWKHHHNPFGRSPAWVAVDGGGRVVGLRTWLRWEFEDGRRQYRAVRAVDTATHPDVRGRGLFTRLTLDSLEHLRAEGVDFVFNTPNEQSRPGYLKMGWREVGTLPVRIRPTSLGAVARIARARVPADKWSLPGVGGVPATEALADVDPLRLLLGRRAERPGLRTRLDPAVLAWRYGFEPLQYRGIWRRDRQGLVLYRVRRRGRATECVITQVLAADPRLEGSLVRTAARASGADYALRIDGDVLDERATLPVPGLGPVLTWREVGDVPMPPLAHWDLAMGDVELF